MKLSDNIYTRLGLGLVLGGVGLSPVSFLLLHSTPLTALGISLLILGAACFVLGRASPYVSPEVSALLIGTGYNNIGALVEELGLSAKAVYLPSSLGAGEARALIPLHSNPSLPPINTPLPRRMIVKFGPNPEDMGLLIATPGSAAVKLLEAKPGDSPEELETALTFLLVGRLDLVDRVRVGAVEQGLEIEMTNPRLSEKGLPFYDFLGSPLASIAAAVAAESLGKPLTISAEKHQKGRSVVTLEVVR